MPLKCSFNRTVTLPRGRVLIGAGVAAAAVCAELPVRAEAGDADPTAAGVGDAGRAKPGAGASTLNCTWRSPDAVVITKSRSMVLASDALADVMRATRRDAAPGAPAAGVSSCTRMSSSGAGGFRPACDHADAGASRTDSER